MSREVEWLTDKTLEEDEVVYLDMSTLQPTGNSNYGRPVSQDTHKKLMEARQNMNPDDDIWQKFDLTTRVEACLMTLDSMKTDVDVEYSFYYDHSPITRIYFEPGATIEDVREFVEYFNEDHEYGQFAGMGSTKLCENPDAAGNDWEEDCWVVEVLQV